MQIKKGEKAIKNQNYFPMNTFAVAFERCILTNEKKICFKQVIAVQKITPPTVGLLRALPRHAIRFKAQQI